MRIENMFLLRLVSVSKGSFQPEIWIADPSASQAPLTENECRILFIWPHVSLGLFYASVDTFQTITHVFG